MRIRMLRSCLAWSGRFAREGETLDAPKREGEYLVANGWAAAEPEPEAGTPQPEAPAPPTLNPPAAPAVDPATAPTPLPPPSKRKNRKNKEA